MVLNLKDQPLVTCISLEEAQTLFEQAISDGVMYDDFELQEEMSFKRKDSSGNYMCCATLAVFKMFCLGLEKGHEKGFSTGVLTEYGS